MASKNVSPTGITGTQKPWHLNADVKIRLLTENPHRENTQVWKKYESYKHASTVGEAKNLDASAWDLQECLKKGYLSFIEGAEIIMEGESSPENI